MMKKKVLSAEEAANLIDSGDTVAVAGHGSVQLPDKVLQSLENRFLVTGKPRDLTLLLPVAPGALKGTGSDRLGHEGLVKRLVTPCVNYFEQRRITELILQNKIEAYLFPMGVMFRLLQSIAGRELGVFTCIGLHTFVDPRYGGGKRTSLTKENLVELLEISGQEVLFYKAFPIQVSIIRGTTADEDGYVTAEHEPSIEGILPLALAAKNSGGKVIAQVNRLARRGSLDPKLVKVPGPLVDYVVVDKDQQSTHKGYNPALVGEIQAPDYIFESLPLTHEKIICRRTLFEIQPNDCVDLGIGIPVSIGSVGQEEGLGDQITFCTEHGGFGGIPAEKAIFGTAINPRAILDSLETFVFFNGGGLDVACLSFVQVDRNGNVNVTKHGNMLHSCGGFMDITHRSKKIIFCGTFTAGGLETGIRNSELHILKEGKHKKFLNQVEEITAVTNGMLQRGQKVLYVTERAVFDLASEGLCLTEIAPGVDLEKDILQLMEFRPRIAANLKRMDHRIFSPEPMNLLQQVGA
jgi:propionate CoA-transferase